MGARLGAGLGGWAGEGGYTRGRTQIGGGEHVCGTCISPPAGVTMYLVGEMPTGGKDAVGRASRYGTPANF